MVLSAVAFAACLAASSTKVRQYVPKEFCLFFFLVYCFRNLLSIVLHYREMGRMNA